MSGRFAAFLLSIVHVPSPLSGREHDEMDASLASHPTDSTLRAYALGTLEAILEDAVEQHLERCPECQSMVTGYSSDSFLGRLRGAREMPSPGSRRADSLPPRPAATRSHQGGDAARRSREGDLPPGLANHPDYEIRRELGRGGMGVVYLAHNRLMGRDEVLKVMGPHIMERPGVLDRFQQEIRAVAKLRHPNIVTAYSAFRIGSGLVFAMEYVEGLDLSRLIKLKGPLPVGHAAYFAHQVALGLQHAHERGTVHRDIKPHNLMLTHDGKLRVVKILDFGLAKATREQKVDAGLTHEGQALGTPDYIAPEQILNAPDVDIRADIYSLGCTLHYFLAGRAPFQAASLYDLYQAHISRDAGPLNLIRPEVPAELAALVAKMLAKDPRRRFQTPGAVAQALVPFFKKSAAGERSQFAQLSRIEPPPVARKVPPIPDQAPPPAPVPERARSRTQPAAPPPAREPEVAWSSLISIPEVEPAPKPAAEGASSGGRPRWLWPAVGGALVGVLLLIWALGVIRVKTREGTIVLDELPKDAEVLVDGERIRVTWPNGGGPAEIRVPAGERGIEVVQDGNRMFGSTVTIAAGDTEPLTVRLEPMPRPIAPEGYGSAEVVRGTWAVEDEELVLTQPLQKRDAVVMLGDRTWSHYDLSFRAMATGGTHGFKAFFHFTDQGHLNFALGNYHNQGADLSYWRDGRWGRDPGMYRKGGIEFDRWYDVLIEVRGPAVRCLVDGAEFFRHRDERFHAGRLALAAWESTARFQDIRVTTPEGELLWRGPPRIEPDPEPDQDSDPEPTDFTSLFNGKDLTGWTTHPSQPGGWRVEGGVLIGSGDRISHLYTEVKDYEDVHLRVEARINEGGNSGVLSRATFGPALPVDTPRFPRGYEAQINCTHRDPNRTGSLYRGVQLLTGVADSPLQPGEWFTLELLTLGTEITVKVNGRVTAVFSDAVRLAASGRIALQLHNPETVVEFRKIELRELNRASVRPSSGAARGQSTTRPEEIGATLADLTRPIDPSFEADPKIDVPHRPASPAAPVLDGVIRPGEYGPALPIDFGTSTSPGRLIRNAQFNMDDVRRKGPEDLSAFLFTAYTAEALHLAVLVYDDVRDDQVLDAHQPWFNDAVDLFLDPDLVANDFTNQTSTGSREGFQIVCDIAGRKATIAQGVSNDDWDVAVGQFPSGRVFEFAIPLGTLDTRDGPGEAAAGPGSTIGFNLGVVDNDSLRSGAFESYGVLWSEPGPGVNAPRWSGEGSWRVRLHLTPPEAGQGGGRETGFRPLLNGSDLGGWKVDRGDASRWRVEGGELVARGSGDYRDQTFLLTDRDYSDFLLRFEFQAPPESDSGVVFRAVPGEFPSPPEVNVRSPPSGTGVHARTGALRWSTSGAGSKYLDITRTATTRPAPAWNAMEVEVRGAALRVSVNGRDVQTTDLARLAARPDALLGLSRRAGRIGFQSHTGTVRFRNIQIQELPGGDPAP